LNQNVESKVKFRFINQVLFYNQNILETILFYYWSYYSQYDSIVDSENRSSNSRFVSQSRHRARAKW